MGIFTPEDSTPLTERGKDLRYYRLYVQSVDYSHPDFLLIAPFRHALELGDVFYETFTDWEDLEWKLNSDVIMEDEKVIVFGTQSIVRAVIDWDDMTVYSSGMWVDSYHLPLPFANTLSLINSWVECYKGIGPKSVADLFPPYFD